MCNVAWQWFSLERRTKRESFFKTFVGQRDILWDHWYLCFGLGMTLLPRGFKARMSLLLPVLFCHLLTIIPKSYLVTGTSIEPGSLACDASTIQLQLYHPDTAWRKLLVRWRPHYYKLHIAQELMGETNLTLIKTYNKKLLGVWYMTGSMVLK